MKDGTVRMNPGVLNPDVVEPVGPTDPQFVLMVLLDAARGTPVACVGNYALHYVGGMGGSTSVSADYFALMEQVLNRESGRAFPVLWLNGCCGDVNNVDVMSPRPTMPPGGKTRQVAEELGHKVMAVWDGLSFTDCAPLDATLEAVPVRRRTITDRELEEARAYLAGHSDETDREWLYAREKTLLAEWPETEPGPAQAIRIGDLGIATLPGEIFCQFGLDIKAASPFENTMVVELANGYVGYVPTVEGFDEGGYETWTARSSRLAPEAGPAMAHRASELLSCLR
jgi:hypothetical protein